MKHTHKSLIAFYLLFFAGAFIFSQTKFQYSGTLVDSVSGETLPLVGVSLKNEKGTVGLNTNLDGEFFFVTEPDTYKVEVKYFGYYLYRDTIIITDHDMNNQLIQLAPVEIGLDVVVINASDNPAHRIIKNVINRRKYNRFENIDAYEYEAYNKLIISMDNVTDKFLSNKLIKGVGNLVKGMVADSLKSDSATYKLAVFVSESVSRFYYKQPDQKKEEILAVQTSGVKGTEYNLLSSMFLQIDVYENNIDILDRQLVSPIAEGAFLDYDYQLITADANLGDTLYGIKIIPRRPWDPVFKGMIYVDNRDWAVNRIELTLNKNPNINFVEDIRIRQEYQKQDSFWVPILLDLEVDFQNSLTKRTGGDGIGLIGRTSNYLYNYKINEPKDPKFYRQEVLEIKDDADEKDSTFWADKRKSPLDKSETLGYSLVDSLKSRGVLDFYINAVKFITWGTKEFKYFEVGPYFYLIGFNQAEGYRTRCGIYTNDAFSKRLYLGGHLAYGFRDQRLKYLAEIRYRLIKSPKLEVGVRTVSEVEQVGFENFLDNGTSLLQTMLRRVPLTQLNYYKENKVYFNSDITKGVACTIWGRTKFFEPASTFDFAFLDQNDNPGEKFKITEAGIRLRLSFKEKYINSGGDKIYIGTKFPIIFLSYARGIKGALNGQFNYDHFSLNSNGRIKYGRFGFTWYWVKAGVINGTLPYPSLYVFRGNQTWGYSYEGFNMMNYYEFVADRYVTISIDHHLEGLIWNKLPLLRRLKWKEVITGRLGYGTLSDANKKINKVDVIRDDGTTFNQELNAPSKFPYLEAGVGLENIFKVIRIDGVWRLNYHNLNYEGKKPNFGPRNNFGIRMELTVRF